jgi:tetratricopeptide (TPR) repeat protein
LIAEELHFSGVNLRHLGLVRRAVSADHPQLRSFLLAEAVARAAKGLIRLEMETEPASFLGKHKQILLHHLNALFSGTRATSSAYWFDVLVPHLEVYFPHTLTDEEKQPGFDHRACLPAAWTLRRLQDMLGFQLSQPAAPSDQDPAIPSADSALRRSDSLRDIGRHSHHDVEDESVFSRLFILPEPFEISDILEENLGFRIKSIVVTTSHLEVLRQLGRGKEAVQSYRNEVEMREKVLGPFHPFVASSLESYAGAIASEDFPGATQLLLRSIEIRKKFVALLAQKALRSSSSSSSSVSKEDEAMEPRHLEQYQKLLDSCSMESSQLNLANSYYSLAKLQAGAGRIREAEQSIRSAIEIKERVMGRGHVELVPELYQYACILRGLSQFQQSEAAYTECIEILEQSSLPKVNLDDSQLISLERHLDIENPWYADVQVEYARLCIMVGNYSLAFELQSSALDFAVRVCGNSHSRVGTIVQNLGISYILQNK